ncbi:hypothetical protein Z945_2620 [Sulfitobacter noctilucae]|uniref:hypothetical protein n=1 Tax=Sulfitobacter noctilucae TaxID=1342302 RepID=UPI00046850B5|nr:hypothetical protein [Sulfitobacter noctilucae]KIN61627.1 hypothetical protein Z945_2620 [Sulfitobacter noctilucae]
MKLMAALFLAYLPAAALACDAPVCLVDPESLNLPQVITFDGIRSSGGPGHQVNDVLPLPGATFGERFAGQTLETQGPHDTITGTAFGPLTMMAGAEGQNLSVVHFSGQTVLNGYGAAGFPKREAQGEGAIAVLFDADQSALAFDLRGGEAGAALVAFYRRDGVLIGQVPVQPTGEFAVGFLRQRGISDIAGFVLTNTDPEGIAIDTLRFGKAPDLS